MRWRTFFVYALSARDLTCGLYQRLVSVDPRLIAHCAFLLTWPLLVWLACATRWRINSKDMRVCPI